MAIEQNQSVATNKFASYGLFYNRELYKTRTYPEQDYDVAPIDLWYISSAYGKVDQLGNTVKVNRAYIKKIKSSNNDQLFALNFVADAFKDLKTYMVEAGFQNKIETTGTKYFDLQPYRGWTSVDVEFDNYMQVVYDAFYEGFMAEAAVDKKLTGFASFLKVFSGFIDRITPKFLFTKTGFISSRYGSPLACGLMLDLSIDKNGDDSVKYTDFITDKNFTFFTKAAEKFGFLIDKNAPWRLVANIGSVPMQNYMRKYNLTLDNVFKIAYSSTYQTDIDDLKGYLREFYNAYASSKPQVRIMKVAKDHNTALSTTLYTRVLINEIPSKDFDDTYWLKYYLFIRGKELDRPWRQVTFDRLCKTTFQVYKFQTYKKALNYVQRRVRDGEFKFLPLTNKETHDKIEFDFLNTSTPPPLFKLF